VVAIGSMLTLVLIVGGLGFLLVWTLHTPIAESLANWPSIKQQANDVLLSASDRLRLEDELTVERLFELGSGILTGGSSGTWLNQAADSVSTVALALLVILIATMYLLSSDRGSLSGPAIKLLPARRQEPTRQACEDLECHYRWWAIGTSFSMLVIGVTSGLGYWIVGLDFALALGILAGLTQAIPTFGPMLALAIALAVAATQGLTQLIGVGAVYVVVQTLESYFLTPMVMMRAVHIPPIVTLFTVIFWGNIFGVAGLILAVPIDLTIWAMLKHHIADFHRRDDPMQST
jgi:predicted PurR-regulated permease PerM